MLKGALTPSRWQCKIGAKDGFGNTSPLGGAHTTRADTEGLAEAAIQQPGCVQAPFLMPSLHAFSRCLVYFLLDKQSMDNVSNIQVVGVASTGEEISVDIPVERLASVTTIHFLAAKALMSDLETGQSWLHAEKSGICRDMHPDDFERTVRNQAETYGREWGITGKWTSFVAVQSTTQIEMASRIYRADRSELSDLTRQRYQFGYNAPSCPHPAVPGAEPFLGLPRASSICYRRNYRKAQCFQALVTTENHMVGPDIDAQSWMIPTPRNIGSSAGSYYTGRSAPTNDDSDISENTAFLPAGSHASVRTEDEKLAPETTTLHCSNFGASTRDSRDPIDSRDSSFNETSLQNLVFQRHADETGISTAPSPTNQYMGEAPRNPGLEFAAAIALRPSLRSKPTSLMGLIDQQSHTGFFNLRGFIREAVLSNFPYQLLERMLWLLTEENKNKTHQRYLNLCKWRAELICETMIVIFYIENQYPSSSELWELVIRKARAWVQRWVGPKTVREALTDLVRRFGQQSDDGSTLETSNNLWDFQPGHLGERKDTASTSNNSLEQQSERPRSRDRQGQWQSSSPLERRLPKMRELLPDDVFDGENRFSFRSLDK